MGLIENLPLDVLFLIFEHLSPTEVWDIGTTCTRLYRATSEVSVWVNQSLCRRTGYPKTQENPIATDGLRKKLLREAAVDRMWRRSELRPTRVWVLEPNHPTDKNDRAFDTIILKGGRHILLAFRDGLLDTRSVATGNSTLAPAGSFNDPEAPRDEPLKFYRLSLKMFSETNGYLIVGSKAPADHEHWRFYLIRIEPDVVVISPLGTLVTSSRYNYTWSMFGRRACSVYHTGMYTTSIADLYLSVIDMPAMGPGPTSVLTEKRYHLKASSRWNHGACDFTMISFDRIIVAGVTPDIWVYDIPPHSDDSVLPLDPIWQWKDEDYCGRDPPLPNFSPPSYGKYSGTSTCWVADDEMGIHFLHVSATGDPIKEIHHIYDVEFYYPTCMSHTRALSIDKDDDDDTLFGINTLTFENPIATGSIIVALPKGLKYSVFSSPSFDDDTGRILLTVEMIESGERFCLVLDIL